MNRVRLEVGDLFNTKNFTLMVTSVDRSKYTGTFSLFSSREEALDVMHSNSLKLCPEWHKENCDICKKLG